MIDQTLAERFFAGQEPLGKRLSIDPDGNGKENKWYQIVGIVSRAKFHGASEVENVPVVYFPHAQVERRNLVLLARTTMNTAAFEQTVKRIVAAMDPRQPVYDTRSMSARVAETWATQRLLTFLLSAFAGLALVLATIGLYGVIAYTALRRLREIGVRLALGAQRSDIHALIVSHGARLLVIGLLLGLCGSLVCSRFIAGVLFQTAALDPLTYLSVCAVLAGATLLACWFPARRAARVDPIITLRAE
jgi:putative ABC transport system permease protein